MGSGRAGRAENVNFVKFRHYMYELVTGETRRVSTNSLAAKKEPEMRSGPQQSPFQASKIGSGDKQNQANHHATLATFGIVLTGRLGLRNELLSTFSVVGKDVWDEYAARLLQRCGVVPRSATTCAPTSRGPSLSRSSN